MLHINMLIGQELVDIEIDGKREERKEEKG